MLTMLLLRPAIFAAAASASVIARQILPIGSCPGYAATNVQDSGTLVTADLTLAGPACNTFGYDLGSLKLEVDYQTASRLHVKIWDPAEEVYQVPESVFPRPSSNSTAPADSALAFNYIANPFSFAVTRKEGGETLFNTTGSNLIFESQYLRVRTSLPESPHLYGLGEHTDPFQLNTNNYVRTLWSRDAYLVPTGTNLYGNHPIYFDHRGISGTHGVFLLNSNGMDIKINSDAAGQYLEYNTIGGIVDLYFLAGPTPKEVSQQYAEVAGLPAMHSYWSLGFHQCRYGYQDVYEVAEVVANYSLAGIPLETMWTDIDYMDARKVFTLDPQRFPLNKMRELVDYLHNHDQHYVVMVDPAVAYQDYEPFNTGVSDGIFLKIANGSVFKGVVWPGPTAFPDWFNPKTQTYWNNEFDTFFSGDTGLDIDALWIDMNEASNFCPYPCADPDAFAIQNGDPPPVPPVRPNAGEPIPGFPADFQPPTKRDVRMRQAGPTGSMIGLPGRDLISPPYAIANAAPGGALSMNTLNTDLVESGGYVQYDTHNLYGTMMSSTSRQAMLSRRPTRRPTIITRSTFAGAGKDVGHWLGDNVSDWDHYRISIAELLEFGALFQVPMVGSDVCGYADNTTENLCARWAMLGAFSPFYRNHNANGNIPQEFYRWASVTQAAKTAIDARYRLLDYLYTAMYEQTQTGTPLVNPLFFNYPEDTNTFAIQLQYFFGNSILVSPVTDEDSTTVGIYLPNDIFYDFFTHAPVRGTGAVMTLTDVPFTSIPLHIKGGAILPLRIESANTTTALRTKNFQLVVAPDLNGQASGSLYLDEGDALDQPLTSNIQFTYANGVFNMEGTYGYPSAPVIESIVLLNAASSGNAARALFDAKVKSLTVSTTVPLTKNYSVKLQ